jgi:hypothetical protein
MRVRGLLVALSVCGCAGASAGAVGSAVLNTAIAAGASGVSRAQGGCYASCPAGTTCNGETGYCDTLPCRGRCLGNEVCVVNGGVDTCLNRSLLDLQLDPSMRALGAERATPR